MEPLSVGTDIIELERIRAAVGRYGSRFVERVYTESERARASQLRDPTPFFAGRFAAKEAVLKVLGTGLRGGIRWRDVNVVREPSGAPTVVLEGEAREVALRIGLERVLLSISHCREYAVAHAIGLRG